MFDPDDDDAVMPRPDGRRIIDQLHNRLGHRDGQLVPMHDGSTSLPVRTHDLAEWLLAQPDMPICLDDGNVGPEGGDCCLFEVVTAHDDPDPYETVVARPYTRKVPR